MTKFAKGDVVRVHASKFDGDADNVDELGLTYSQRMIHDKKGEWCYGRISLVFTKKSTQPQKYKIKYHEGGSMDALEADIEMPGEEEMHAREHFQRLKAKANQSWMTEKMKTVKIGTLWTETKRVVMGR